MNDNPNNPRAFPSTEQWRVNRGMTLLDYFAAKAMQTLLREYKFDDNLELAQHSYKMAKDMLEARQAIIDTFNETGVNDVGI